LEAQQRGVENFLYLLLWIMQYVFEWNEGYLQDRSELEMHNGPSDEEEHEGDGGGAPADDGNGVPT
jgi:hypothetical protein